MTVLICLKSSIIWFNLIAVKLRKKFLNSLILGFLIYKIRILSSFIYGIIIKIKENI